MTKDLWTRTNSDQSAAPGRSVSKPKNLTEDPNGMVTIELSGPQMVDYLQILDYNAHDGASAHDPSLAGAVYTAVAPVVDKIQASPAPGAPEPEIIIDAAVGTDTSAAVAPSTSAGAK